MKPISFEGLEPDIFFAQTWYQDLATAYANFLNKYIRDPMNQLEHIRDYSYGRDPEVLQMALEDMGFILPEDIAGHNYDTLHHVMHQLPNYCDRSGTKGFDRQISFLMGRYVTTESLYTKDYQNFYPQPMGALQVDGGEWYKTTHVNLSMQILPGDAHLAIPEGSSRKERLLEVFYDFAPWHLVVKEAYETIGIGGELGLAGWVAKFPKRYLYLGVGANTLDNFRLEGPTDVKELQTAQYELLADEVYVGEDGTPITYTRRLGNDATYTSSRTGLVNFRGGEATFGSVDYDVPVTIYATYKGSGASLNVTVRNDVETITAIRIDGPTKVDTNDVEVYEVVAETLGGDEPLIVPIRCTDVEVAIENWAADFTRVSEDKVVYIEASLDTGKRVLSTALPVTVLKVDRVTVERLEISGPSTTRSDSVVKFIATAFFSDGTHKDVLAYWTSSAAEIKVEPDGTSRVLPSDDGYTATITASYTFGYVNVSATHEIDVEDGILTVVSLTVVGEQTIIENSKRQYRALVRYSNGDSAYVRADWSSTKYSIDEAGVLTVGSIGEKPVDFRVRARLPNITATKDIVAQKEPTVMNAIVITGPSYVNEGNIVKFRCYSQYSNGKEYEVTPEWTIRNRYRWANISENGLFSFSNPETGVIDIEATFTHGGREYSASIPVVLIPETKIIRGLLINGPNEVADGERIFLTATAVYSDGSTEQAQPVWETLPFDEANDDEAMVDVVSPGVVQGRPVDVETKAIVRARYFKEVAEFVVTVKPYVYDQMPEVLTSRIIGPDTFNSDETGSYGHAIIFANCDEETEVSGDWTLDIDPNVARVDQYGNVLSVNGKSVTGTLTSTYTCGNETVTASKVISIVSVGNPTIDSLVIRGPSVIYNTDPILYEATLFYTDGRSRPVTATWTLVDNQDKVTLTSGGRLAVTQTDSDFMFTIQATYTEDYETVTDTLVVQVSMSEALSIVYGVGPIGIDTEEELAVLENTLDSYQSGFEFTLLSGDMEYLYFCIPVGVGEITFFDLSNELEGGWDGASWPDDGGIGNQFGPIVIQRTDSQGQVSDWYLYRSDFAGLGEISFRTTYKES
jgi:hypothetical protein